ncbi:hypothetical protein PG985_009723 [Apiospora marii]|uniref:uncharacterized protein n=1 Tax=Apiospora marii TaxID=335849 RepID=UPI00312E634C
MKYSLVQVTTTLLAGMAAARGVEKRHGGGKSSDNLHVAMADVIDATNTLDHVVSAYSGGEAEEVDCAVNTAVTVLRHATEVANTLAAPMSEEEAEDWKASTVKLCDVGDSLVKTFDAKVEAFNDARICNSVNTHVTDLDDQVTALIKAVGNKLPEGSDAAFPQKTKTYFSRIKDGMDEHCNACGVLDDAPYSGVPLNGSSSTGTTGAGIYPGPIITNGAAAVGVSGVMGVLALVAFLV